MARMVPPGRATGNKGGRLPGHVPSNGNGSPGRTNSYTVGHLLLPYPTANRHLSIKEARFVNEFLKDMDANYELLAIRAGFSAKTAKSIGCQVLKRPHVQAEIRDQLHAFVQRERLSIQRLVRHLIELAEVDKRDFFQPDGTLTDMKNLTKTQAALVNGITVTELWGTDENGDRTKTGELKKVTFTDHLKPIQMLAKSLQGFVDRVEVRGTIKETRDINVTTTHKMEIDLTLLTIRELKALKALHYKASGKVSNRDRNKAKAIQ